MPQVYMIIGPSTQGMFQADDIGVLASKLILVTEIGFGLRGKNDTAFTAVNAVSTVGEADIQVEVRYTAGEDEYQQGKPFDPTPEEQESVASMIKTEFMSFCLSRGKKPLSLSVWCKPYHNTLFKSWGRE